MEFEDMNDPWYNNIVNKDFDADYENVMNRVEEKLITTLLKVLVLRWVAVTMGVPMMEMTTITTMMMTPTMKWNFVGDSLRRRN